MACWMTSTNKAQMDQFIRVKSTEIALDKDGNFVFLAPSAWMLQKAHDNYPDIEFHKTSEFKMSLV